MAPTSPPSPIHFLLVRHGESTWNAAGRWQGQADPPLTDRGRDQAAAAAAGVPRPVAAVVASDLQRALHTAQGLADGAALGPVEVDPRLRERNAGEFSGLTRAEIHRQFPGLLPDDPVREPGTESQGLIAPPGWESDADLRQRAWSALGELAERVGSAEGPVGDHSPRTVVVVTHSGLIYALEAELGLPGSRISNLEGRWIIGDDQGWRGGERVLLFNPDEVEVTSPDQL